MRLRFLFSLLAFLAFIALVWWVGPIVSVGSVQPLSSTWARIAVSVLVFLFIFAPLLWRWWQVRKAELALKTGLTLQDEQARAQSAALHDIFHRAVHTLKQHQCRGAWYQSKPGLYQLPWYVMIGPPGSGKTTALKNGGLRFPLQDPLGNEAIKGVGGTRNCDWWFTDQAVLIDTAGRFTTQDSDHNTDSAGWNAFLRLLKKHRPKQPLNGVLLTISIQDLLDSEPKRKDTASRIAMRLQEMIRALGTCPPVYVLVTKLDLLPGFKETFGRLDESDRAKAWGINFDHPNKLDDTLANCLPMALDDMIDTLQGQLHSRLLHESQEIKRLAQFEFPLAFAQLKPAVKQLLEHALHTGSPFEQAVTLRGVYFSSGTQDGNVFDRIASALAPTDALHDGRVGAGKSFFIRDLLIKVVFAEKHVAAYVKKNEVLEQAAYLGGLGGAFLLLAGLSAAWWFSHGHNSDTVAQTIQRTEQLAQQANALPSEAQAPLQPLFKVLDDLQTIAPSGPAKFLHALGLNQDNKLIQAQELAYRKALTTALMPRVVKRLEDRLRAALNQDHELAYESLKAYVMVHTPAHYNATELAAWVSYDWQHNVLASYEPQARQTALQHLASAIQLGAPEQLPPMDQELVEASRQIIGAQALSTRLYNRMVRFYKAEPGTDFNLVGTVGVGASSLFVRASGQSLNEGVDALYTRNAYFSYFLPSLPAQAAQLGQESSWVMNEPLQDNGDRGDNLLSRARELYIRDYISHWDEYLKDVQVQRPANFEQAVDLARVLASPQSPLKKFLEGVSKNTRLAGELSQIGDRAEAVANQKTQALAPNVALLGGSSFQPVNASAPLEQAVDEHFININNLFNGNPPAYTEVSTVLNDLYTQLAATANAKKGKTAPPPAGAIESLQVSAGMLPEPVRAIVGQLAGLGSAQGRAAERANLTAELRPLQDVCKRTVANRYPVHAASGLDVLTDDFARFFGPGGLMDTFFSSKLAAAVDTGNAQWTLKPLSDGSKAPGNASLVQFQRAARIRDVFFAGNKPTPSFDVEMRLINASNPNDVFYLEMNGELKMFSKQFQPSHRIQWGPQPPSATLKIRASEGAYKTYNGPWALFRLFDSAQVQTTEQPEKFKARFAVDGKQFDFEVMANSAFNPLRLIELRQFRCPGDL